MENQNCKNLKLPQLMGDDHCFPEDSLKQQLRVSALVEKMLKEVENLLFESDGVRKHRRSNRYTGIYTFKLK